MTKLSDSEILSAIDAKAKESYGYESSVLSGEREQALNYYLGKPYGNEVEGRSQIVTRDVLETVEWMLPDLLKIFTSGDKVVEFRPKGAEDVDAAEQETDYVNHVALQQNDSFMTMYAWFKDALMLKNGYVKVYWDTSEDIVEDKYENLAPEQLSMLVNDKDVEIVNGEQTELGFNVTLKRKKQVGKVCIEAVPPEEMLVDMACKSLDLGDASYVEHFTRKSISDIRLMGFDVSDDVGRYDSITDDDIVAHARDQYDEDATGYEGADDSTRLVWFRDVTMRIDADGDGIAELMRYYIVGKEIIYAEKAENIYYAALGAIPMPHRHVGLSIADLVMDIQLLRSTIMRQYLDGLFLANNGRYAISDRVNLDDMLTSRPGGVVRVQGEPSTAIMPLVHPNTGSFAIEGLNYLDSQKEVRTGVTKNSQGMNADQLHKTMGGLSAITAQANMRKELIARVFAETGVKRLYSLTHELLKKHADNQLTYKLRNKWIPVDPRQWQTRTDMTISVGLGTGNKDMQLQHIMAIMQVQEKAIALGITNPKQIYNAAKRMAENAGFSDGDEFFTDPSTMPPKPPAPPPPNPMAEVEHIKQQGAAQKFQAETQVEMQKHQAQMQQDEMAAQREASLEMEKIASNERIAAAKIEADKEKVLMELAAGIMAGSMGQTQSVDDTTNIDDGGAALAQQPATLQDLQSIMQAIQGMAASLSAPKYIVRDANGRAIGIQQGGM